MQKEKDSKDRKQENKVNRKEERKYELIQN